MFFQNNHKTTDENIANLLLFYLLIDSTFTDWDELSISISLKYLLKNVVSKFPFAILPTLQCAFKFELWLKVLKLEFIWHDLDRIQKAHQLFYVGIDTF